MPGWQATITTPARGSALIEVLAAVALLATALTGLLSTHWQARRLQLDALQHQHALFLLDDLATRMRLNASAADSYRQLLTQAVPTASAADTCAVAACTPEARARADLIAFVLASRRLLPQPVWQLQACLDSAGDCLLLAWAGTHPDAGPDGQCLDASGERRPGARCQVLELP